ncbi:MAG: DUF3168 domain-containing protein [Sporichthyaceae bacterium]|nr:DUF3168 domain-containing protein [Sporichthyaceae bacterium]
MIEARLAAAAVQAALYARLAGDPELAGLARGYDHVPEGAAHPYWTVGEAIETPNNHHGGFGRQVLATVHVWSTYRGYAEGLAIAARIVALLDHQPLTIAGHHTVAVRHELTQTLRDPDPDIRHMPVQFRIVTEQKE